MKSDVKRFIDKLDELKAKALRCQGDEYLERALADYIQVLQDISHGLAESGLKDEEG